MLLEFLLTDIPKEKLQAALEVIITFKFCEDMEEYVSIPFEQWVKLEQLQDYLRLLTGTDVEKVDDDIAIKFYENHVAEVPIKIEKAADLSPVPTFGEFAPEDQPNQTGS